MRGAGVEIELYRPLHWYHLARLNNRTHRKLLVVDGRVGFTGGVGIADKWAGNAQDPDHWRDSHYRAEGPVVAQMQATFLDNWTKVTGVVLHGEDYFPALEPVGDARAQMFSSSPEGGAESMQLMYLLAITSASRSIELASAYFVPDELTTNALVEALKRGVKVRMILPGPIIDTDVVRRASRAAGGRCSPPGAQIHEYQPTMFHCKVMIVDGLLVSVGSTNFDVRSFRLNDEANLNVYDPKFAAAPGRGLRAGPREVAPHHVRAVAGPSLAREVARTHCRIARPATVSGLRITGVTRVFERSRCYPPARSFGRELSDVAYLQGPDPRRFLRLAARDQARARGPHREAGVPARGSRAFNTNGARVRMPVKGREGLVEVDSRKLPGKLSAAGPGDVEPADYDLVALAMQEPQYRSPGVRELLDAVAKAKVPCMSIMNMPPLPYLARIPGIERRRLPERYTDATVWDSFDPELMTLCSPDPQAFRPPEEKVNVLQVRLPTNFKAARSLRRAHRDAARARGRHRGGALRHGAGKIELPVKLKVHDSVFVPLAKWTMLLAGNYRCVQKDGMRSIKDAVHSDLEASRAVYEWVAGLCKSLGAAQKDLVPFEKYAAAAQSLRQPVLRRARAGRRRAEHRARRPAGADDRRAARHAERRVGSDRRTGRRWLEKNRKA